MLAWRVAVTLLAWRRVLPEGGKWSPVRSRGGAWERGAALIGSGTVTNPREGARDPEKSQWE